MLEVKRLRQAREWNQTQLAFHAGLAPSVISEIENGKRDPSARTLRKLAEALEVDVADLFPKGGRSSLEPTFNDVLGDEQRTDIFELALAAARGQAEQDRKAANRTLASEGIPQPSYFKDHENAIIQRLLEYPADELAGSLMELAGRVVQLEEEPSERRLTEAPEYVDRLEELGFPRAQIAAWMAQEEHDKEFITRELEKMSAKDFREALLASPGLRRVRDYYRKTEAEASTPSRSESA